MSAKIDERILRDIESQLQKWSDFLNVGVGSVSFNFAIACSGSQYPAIFSILSFVIVLSILIKGKNISLRRYMNLEKNN